MFSDEEYSEELPCGGTLCVNSFERYIRYYFPGPDRRYNGTSLRIWIQDLPSYIVAYRKNWERYCELKKTIPPGGSCRVKGMCEMEIFVGEVFDGVSLESHHMILNSFESISIVTNSFKYAIKRSDEIRSSLYAQRPNSTPPNTGACSSDATLSKSSDSPSLTAPPDGQLKYDLSDSRRLFDFMDSESVLSAVKRGHDLAYLSEFIDAGASLSFRSPFVKCTPLHQAARYRDRAVVELLVKKGADIDAIDKNGQKPLDYARQAGSADVVDFLERYSIVL